MSRNDSSLSKENWQSFGMWAGPSNVSGLSIPAVVMAGNSKVRSPSKTTKQTWTCNVCKKELSSKRSYTEHMNIHNKTRPFRCENCTYAAASQMTLHRHKLRNHTPKTEWGYRCPYCEDAYMEPAGYQQHVQQRHTGKSATYGCPFRVCKFTSKSQRHFREHLAKHDRNDKIEGGVDPCVLSNQQLVRYMVNDEIGVGSERSTTSSINSQKLAIRTRPQVGIAPKMYTGSSGNRQNPPGTRKQIWQVERSIRNVKCEPLPAAASVSHRSSHPSNQMIRYYVPTVSSTSSASSAGRYLKTEPLPQTYDEIPTEFEVDVDESDFDEIMEDIVEDETEELEEDEEYDEGPPILDRQEEEVIPEAFSKNWIENEIEITSNDVEVFPNGFIDEELD